MQSSDWRAYVREHLKLQRVAAAREVEIVEELAVQLELAYQEGLRAGLEPFEAERNAKAQLPDFQKLALEIEGAQPRRHRQTSDPWRGVPGDLRHAFRTLRKSPVFAIVAIATLAIGIGGCTAIFSLIEAVILRPIAYREPDQLVMVWEDQYKRGFHKNVVAMADYLDWKARNHVFSDISPILDQVWNLSGHGEPAVLKGIATDERFLPMLGVEPLLGRSFSVDETKPGGPSVVILSHRVWVQYFGASGDAIGQKMWLDGEPRTIIGVLPIDFPWLGQPLDTLTPAQFAVRDWRHKAGRFLRVAGRLKPGVSLRQAQDEMSAIAKQLEVEYPEFSKDWGVEIVPLAEHFSGEAGTSLWILLGAVALVLLIACSNVANLMLARSVAREREMALRAALGATRQRLIRQLMIESGIVALAGGILGCAGAVAAIQLIQTYGPQNVSRLSSAGLNLPVVLFALLASCGTCLIFGFAPAVAAGQLNVGSVLKDGGRGVLNTIRGERARSIFVVAQVAFALVLLTGASLLIEGLYRLNKVPLGFDPRNVLTGEVMFSGKMSDEQLGVMCHQIIDKLKGLPAVENAGFITWLPFAGMGAATGFTVVGDAPYAPGQTPVTDVRIVLPGYFETMRIGLRKGRLFEEQDNRAGAPLRFVVNEALANRISANGRQPLGQRLVVQMGNDKPGEIIGVVADTKLMSIKSDVRPMVYYVQAGLPIGMGSFVVRTKSAGTADSLGSAMTAAVQAVKSDQPVTDVRTMEDWIGRSTAALRFQTGLLSAFALIAVALAVLGVYGVMAYSVEQRTHEMGIRMALGAEPSGLRRLVALRGMRLAGVGLVLGIAGALASTRVLASLLYQVSPSDPVVYSAAAIVLAVACLAASYLPARRATLVDPVVALRGE